MRCLLVSSLLALASTRRAPPGFPAALLRTRGGAVDAAPTLGDVDKGEAASKFNPTVLAKAETAVAMIRSAGVNGTAVDMLENAVMRGDASGDGELVELSLMARREFVGQQLNNGVGEHYLDALCALAGEALAHRHAGVLDGDAARRVLAVLAGDAGHRGDDATARFTAQFVARATAGVAKLRETLGDAAGFVARARAKVERGLPALLEMQARAAKEGGAAKAKLDEQVAQMRVLQGDDGAAIEKLRADMVAQLDAAEAKGGEVAVALLAQQLRPMVDDMLGADVNDSEGGEDN